MTFKESMDYLDIIRQRGSVLGLDGIRELLRRLGNPQDKLRFVHIAGTNGKGSTLSYISTILTEAGYKTGRYISPTIESYCEKIQIDGQWIDAYRVADYISSIKEAADAMISDGFDCPTVFEMETAMAFCYFLDENVDIVVLETGMGGLDDATNVITTTVVSVITAISLDHVGMIGNTLTEIATTKAGIIKEGVPVVVYGDNEPEVINAIINYANYKNSEVRITHPELIVRKSNNLSGQIFDYDRYTNIKTRLLGAHQLFNAVTAIETINVLRESGFIIMDEHILNGIYATSWPARFEVVSGRPLMIIDGAHNPDGAIAFSYAVKEYLSDYNKIFVMGVLADKDYMKMIEITSDFADAIITINPDNARALDDSVLQEAIESVKTRNIPVVAAGRVEAGIELANQIALQLRDEKTAIVIFGSLSFMGDVKRYLGGN